MDKMILYEDDALFVVHKPQGIATQTARIGQVDVVSELKNYRKSKGENTYIGVIHRLDQPVEGLLVFAKTPQAATALSSQLHTEIFEKRYIAFLDGIVNEGAEAELTNYLWKDSRANLSKVVNSEMSGAKMLCSSIDSSCLLGPAIRLAGTKSFQRPASLLESGPLHPAFPLPPARPPAWVWSGDAGE